MVAVLAEDSAADTSGVGPDRSFGTLGLRIWHPKTASVRRGGCHCVKQGLV